MSAGPTRRLDPALATGLLIFVAGWWWAPSSEMAQNRAHDFVFLVLALPLAALGGGSELMALARTSAVARLALLLAGWMAATLLWRTGAEEISPVTVLGQVALTLIFFGSAARWLAGAGRERLERWIVAAGSTAALAALVAHAAGRSYLGRLNSAVNFEHPNLFAQSCGVATLVALARLLRGGDDRRWTRSLGLAAVALPMVALLLTRGRLSLVALAAAVLLLLAASGGRSGRLGIAGMALAAAATAAAVPGLFDGFFTRGDAARGDLYAEFWRRTEGARWGGRGLTAAQQVIFPPGEFPRGATLPHAHSLPLATFYFGGVVALLLLALLLVAGGRVAARELRERRDPLPGGLLAFGTLALLFDGHRLFARPHLSSWLLLWLPLALLAAAERRRAEGEATGGSGGAAPPEPPPGGAANAGDDAPPDGSLPRWFLLALGALLVGQRLFHLAGPVDRPLDGRQLEALHRVRLFATEGVDLLRPPVCWDGPGGFRAGALPLGEALAACGWRVAGPTGGRLGFLALFLAGGWAFYRFARELLGRDAGGLAALAWLATPLSLFASRAFLPEGAALSAGAGAAWAFVRATSGGRGAPIAAAVALLLGTLSLLMAPIVGLAWLLVLPAALADPTRRRAAGWVRPAAGGAVVLLGAALLPLAFARGRGEALGDPAGELARGLSESLGWAVGSPGEPLAGRGWLELAERTLSTTIGPALLLPLLAGLAVAIVRRRWALVSAAAAAVLHVAAFSRGHRLDEAMGLALLPAIALLVGAGLAAISPARSGLGRALAMIAAAAILLAGIGAAERRLYRVDGEADFVAERIAAAIGPAGVPVVAWGNDAGRSPRLLARLGRSGWSLPEDQLGGWVVGQLAARGATHLAVVSVDPPPAVADARFRGVAVAEEPLGAAGGPRLRVWRLER